MTELTITPKTADKTARFKGAIAAGEHVAVTIKGGADWLGEDNGTHLSLRVLDLVTGRTLAIFPRPPETEEADSVSEPSASADAETDAETETAPQTDAWSTTGEDNADLYCELNLNTTRMVNAARHMLQVPVLFVMGEKDDQSDAVTRTLYFRDRHEVGFWPERIGDDTPYDLDRWPKQIDEWTEQIEEFTAQLQEMSSSINTALEDVETAISETMPALVESEVAGQLAGKADKVASAVNGNFAALDANGNLKDSGNKAADFADATEFTAHKNNNDIHFSAAERTKLSGIAAGAQVNVIETVQRNGVAVSVAGKAVNILVPTKTSQLENDGGGTGTGFATMGALNSEVSRAQGAEDTLSSRVGAVEGKIPSEASSSNQLADKAHVAAAIAAVKNSRFAVVETLPASGEENVIYLVPAEDGAGDDVFDEYIWLVGSGGVGAWEKIASTRIDLSGYATTAAMNAVLSGKVDVVSGKGLSTNDYTDAEKTKVASSLTSAEAIDGFTKWVLTTDNLPSGCSFSGAVWSSSASAWIFNILDGITELGVNVGGTADSVSITFVYDGTTNVATRHIITPTKTSQLRNDSGFITQHQQLTPVYSQTPTFSEWTFADVSDGITDIQQPVFSSLPDMEPTWSVNFGYDGETRFATLFSSDGDATNLAFVYGDEGLNLHLTATRARTDIIGYTLGEQTTKPLQPKGDYLTAHQSLAGLAHEYTFSDVQTISSAGTEQSPNEVTPVDAQNKRVSVEAANAYIAVALPAASANGHIRDMMLTLDCSTLEDGEEPSVVWASGYVGANGDADNLVADAAAKNVYYVTEYAPNAFLVARQVIGGGS